MRHFITIVENTAGRPPHRIEAASEDYSMEGSVMDATEENVSQWLDYRHHIHDPEIVQMICSYGRVAFLDDIEVYPHARGEGHGNSLMESFLDEAVEHGARACVLAADTSQDQEEGFDLQRWYEGWGFRVIAQASNGPLMMVTQK